MKQPFLRAAGCAMALLLALCPLANAEAIVGISTVNLGGGEFQYDFSIDNTSGTVPIAGLLIEGGNTVFGLDLSSTIGAPAGWDFLSPLPPFDDLLSYFSLTPASDIPIGGSLSGFTFDSFTDPATLSVVSGVLVGDDSSQIPFHIPEPAAVCLLATILIGSGIKMKRDACWTGRKSI
jgi:hypothetical protein